jgi:hypothetical protein
MVLVAAGGYATIVLRACALLIVATRHTRCTVRGR